MMHHVWLQCDCQANRERCSVTKKPSDWSPGKSYESRDLSQSAVQQCTWRVSQRLQGGWGGWGSKAFVCLRSLLILRCLVVVVPTGRTGSIRQEDCKGLPGCAWKNHEHWWTISIKIDWIVKQWTREQISSFIFWFCIRCNLTRLQNLKALSLCLWRWDRPEVLVSLWSCNISQPRKRT